MLSRTALRLTCARWLFLSAVLVGELVGLTVRFDTARLSRSSGIAARWLSHAEFLPEIGVAFAAALLVIGAGRLREIGGLLLAESASYLRWWTFFAAHLAAFVGLYFATERLFEATPAEGTVPAAWLIAWLALTAGTLGLWLGSLAPVATWLRLARRERAALLAGGGVGVAAWAAGRLTQRLWRPLSDGTFAIVVRLLQAMFSEDDLVAYPEDKIVGVGRFVVVIAPDCSGYEGIGLMTVFLAAFLWVFRRSLRFPHALLLWPIGILAIWVANALRITALIVVGARWSHDVAVGGFHSQAGWLAFIALSLGIAAAALRVPFFSRVEPRDRSGRINHTPAYLVPFLVLIATGMITAAVQPPLQGGDVDRLYPVKVLTAGAALCWYGRSLRAEGWSWSWWGPTAGVFVFVLWVALAFYPTGPNQESSLPDQLAEMNGAFAALWLFFRVVGSTLTVPLAEELAFRGYLMRRIGSTEFEQQPYADCSWLAIGISSLLFGLMHGRWVAGTLAGVVYALVARRRGRLADAMIAHAVTNGLIAAAVLLGRAWWLWS